MKKSPFLVTLAAFLALLLVGAFGYRLIEGPPWTFFDGLFMTVITLATVGYSETHPLSVEGRMFTIFLIIVGAGLMAYTVTSIAKFVVEGKLRDLWEHRRMKEQIAAMNGHYIICGAGRTGMEVAQRLTPKKIPLVLIDSDPKVIQDLGNQKHLFLEGDATHDELLLEAGVKKAVGLVAALPTDAANVFVALSAKGLNPNLYVVSTASQTESVPKLKRAGVDYVVSPTVIAGARLAAILTRPAVVDFMDATMTGDDEGLHMEETTIGPSSFLADKALKDTDIRQRSGAIVVAVKRGRHTTINPEPTYVFSAGDTLVILGRRDQTIRLVELAAPNSRM
jgi:voltage-gated potassium channel